MPAPHPNGSWIEAGREAGLLLSAQQGDLESFRELLHAHQRPLYRLCFAMAGEAEEAGLLMFESARMAWRSLRQLPVGRPFYPFVARIARNLAVARRRRVVSATVLPARRPSGTEWAGGTGNPALAAEEQRLWCAFRDLTVDERMLYAMRLLEGLSYAQIAAVLDVPVGSVMHRLQDLRGRFESVSRPEAA